MDKFLNWGWFWSLVTISVDLQKVFRNYNIRINVISCISYEIYLKFKSVRLLRKTFILFKTFHNFITYSEEYIPVLTLDSYFSYNQICV